MIWSISSDKQFKRCPHQWYYSNIVANAKVRKDPYRREVTILSKLQTIEAWRGSVVDGIISTSLVNALNKKFPIKKDYFLNKAMEVFDKQLEYAIFQKYRNTESGLSNDEGFAALLPYEFEEQIDDSTIVQAREDVLTALTNLLDDHPFIDYLKSAKYLVSQRTLIYPFDRFNVRAIPDLIAFFENDPPHIFDWKVHTYGNVSYDEQLIAYAAALYKVAHIKPHEDWPDISKYRIFDYRLTEYQLLHKDRIKRDYEVTEYALEEFSDRINASIIEMYMCGCHKKYDQLTPDKFPSTKYFENCPKCPFKKICKSNNYETGDSYFSN
ncbi:PD-(D/E)XK nuclease family protein [Pedobacter insulae]|uniref:PD-(D/E)XK nuclease superfamily protein n=1 Tax=Pedobacter insulae TaxID=414048 RepID=A0A1I2ZHE0_9SPHI|nr:PD-(D/E)XK nuclease family protein [Pedobacter insulae]SFH36996.1 PD-(D/E)XK nuclease superfamily protein [Pedobacter insulae]